MTTALVFAAFWSLLVATYLRRAAASRAAADWVLDGSGLVMQGAVVPLLQGAVLIVFFSMLAPRWKGCVELGAIPAFLLNFVAVDYLYYWNHRLLHGGGLWRWHAVHHTAERLDVWVTSRNTLLSPFLIVYVWVNAACVFLLKDPAPFLLSAAVTAMLDLWRHSEILAVRPLAAVFVTPHEHAWHHSREKMNCNFGANLTLWDRLHGTYASPEAYPDKLGYDLGWTFPQKLFFTGETR